MILIKKTVLTNVQILYYRPDFSHIIQEFHWQTDDQIPDFPRVKKFLDYWRTDIDAVIREIILGYETNRGVRFADAMFLLDSTRH